MEPSTVIINRLKMCEPFSYEFGSLMYPIFYSSGLNAINRPGIGLAVCFIEGAGAQWFHSHYSRSKHAEWYMVQSWEQFVLRTKWRQMTIRVFQNYSPCKACSDMIKQFVKRMGEQNVKVYVSISFAGLYKISRNPWNPKGHKTHFTLETHLENCRGLSQLAECVNLAPFDHVRWLELKHVLNLRGVYFTAERMLSHKREQADMSIGRTYNNIISYNLY